MSGQAVQMGDIGDYLLLLGVFDAVAIVGFGERPTITTV